MMNKEEAEALMKEVQEDVPKGQTGVIEPEEMPKEGIIELEPDQLLRIELILTKRQKARLAEKLALFQLREAQQELMASLREEAAVLARIAQAHGLSRFQSVKVAGPNKLAYTLG
jgi:hypothetical protein